MRVPQAVDAQPTLVHTLSCVVQVAGLHCNWGQVAHSPPLPPHCAQGARMMVGEAGQPLGAGGAGVVGEGGRTAGEVGRVGDLGAGMAGEGVGVGGVGPGGDVGPALIQLMGQLVPPEQELLPAHMHWHVVA